jgi:hypothetical protein
MPELLSLDEAKEALRLVDDDVARDDLLQTFLDGIASVVEERVGPVSESEVTVDVRRCGSEVVLPYMNVISLTSGEYVTDGTAIDVTGMYADASGVLRNTNGTSLPSTPWRLTMTVGMAEIPAAIKRAAAEILILAWATQRQKPSDEAPAFLVPYRAAAWLAGFERPPRVA